jgi:hypothetical protein
MNKFFKIIFKLFLFLGSGIRIIKIKSCIRIRIKAYADPKHCIEDCFETELCRILYYYY